MTKLQEYLAKKNQAPNLSLKEYIFNTTNKKLEEMINDLKDEFTSQLKIEIENKVNEILSSIKDGEKGEDGYTPIKGVDYFDGKDGRDGRDGIGIKGDKGDAGIDGKDGSPDTPIQIVDKINTLEEVIEQKTIKGLSNIISNLQRAIKEKTVKQMGGGGFSDVNFVESETPTGVVNGVNTDFVLSSTPTPSTSLKVFVNGQRFKITEDYTLSGTTITFVTAPPTSSIILCDYRK
jgi:hypothetical protein